MPTIYAPLNPPVEVYGMAPGDADHDRHRAVADTTATGSHAEDRAERCLP